MGDVVDAADLVLDVVAAPVPQAARHQHAVVGDVGRLVELRPDVVVVGVAQSQGRVVDDGLHGRLQQPVRQIHVVRGGEVGLHEVGQNVRAAAGRLVGRQGAA